MFVRRKFELQGEYKRKKIEDKMKDINRNNRSEEKNKE